MLALSKDSEDELVAFNDPLFVTLMDCFSEGVADVDWDSDGERLVVLLLVEEVNADSSVRIDVAEGFEFGVVTSELLFLSLNPVANEAQPLVFFVVGPFANDEVEIDVDGLLLVGLSNVVESDD